MKNSQKFIIVFLIFTLIFTSFAFLFSEKKEGVLAQEEEILVCHEPIPIGSSLDATLEAMDVLVKETQNIHREVSTQIAQANAALASIGKDAANCDTSSTTCQAMCVNAQVKITFKVTLLWFITVARYPFCIAVCGARQDCLGKPCPALDTQLSSVANSFGRLENSLKKIDDVFSSSTEQIEENIMTKEEEINFNQCLEEARGWRSDEATKITKKELEKCIENLGKITKIEFAQRKLERTRADFHRWRMSPEDWEKVYRAEITPRIAMRCLLALEERTYWPKWWTEDCEEYCRKNPYSTKCQDCLCTGCESTISVWPLPGPRCTDTPTTNSDPEKCQECLDKSPIHQYSWIKATGCKFYGACRKKCEKAISLGEQEECLSCLCEGLPPAKECVQQHGGEDACDEECEKECKVVACQKWICGESMLNWTSCYSY